MFHLHWISVYLSKTNVIFRTQCLFYGRPLKLTFNWFIDDSDLFYHHHFAPLLYDNNAALGVVGANEVDVFGRVDVRRAVERRAERNVGVGENDSNLCWDLGSDSHVYHLNNNQLQSMLNWPTGVKFRIFFEDKIEQFITEFNPPEKREKHKN